MQSGRAEAGRISTRSRPGPWRKTKTCITSDCCSNITARCDTQARADPALRGDVRRHVGRGIEPLGLLAQVWGPRQVDRPGRTATASRPSATGPWPRHKGARRIGCRRDCDNREHGIPAISRIRDVPLRVNCQAPDRALGHCNALWATRDCVLAIDGKTLRGALPTSRDCRCTSRVRWGKGSRLPSPKEGLRPGRRPERRGRARRGDQDGCADARRHRHCQA